jgi:hypothetical protein
MRILYSGDSLHPSSGVARKMIQQAGEWEKRGHQVWLMTPWHHRVFPFEQARRSVSETLLRGPSVRSPYERIHFRTLAIKSLHGAAHRLEADLVYSRELPPAPGLMALLKAFPVVLEVNSDSVKEKHGVISRVCKSRQRELFITNARGVIYVSRELEKMGFAIATKNRTVIANSCFFVPPPVDSISMKRTRKSRRPSLVFIGSEKQSWTGIDKVLWLARCLPEFDFVIIGSVLEGPPNITFHPPMSSNDANEIIFRCTAGISALALHRKGMNEASPLKSRHYLSCGLPVIQAYDDTDITEDDGCILQLPNREFLGDDSPDKVRDFVLRAHASDEPSTKALALARGRLSLEAKETERLEFFEQCLGGLRREVAGG